MWSLSEFPIFPVFILREIASSNTCCIEFPAQDLEKKAYSRVNCQNIFFDTSRRFTLRLI